LKPKPVKPTNQASSGADASRAEKKKPTIGNNLLRWYTNVSTTEVAVRATDIITRAQGVHKTKAGAKPVAAASAAAAATGTSGSLDLSLPSAHVGAVVTRFAPEPSGYLHIGHAKAALLAEHFARTYVGKLILRFDDTNPSKEKAEFELAIREDLRLMGIVPDVVTHTSDYFAQLQEFAEELIRRGLAYVDDTDTETMRDERMRGVKSRYRDAGVLENAAKFAEMLAGTAWGVTACLRAKMSVDDANKALRDPVIYRCNAEPHHVHGTRYKAYPTYDFAAPVVDSIEGVTHALRANEYRDRNPQYQWFLTALGLRQVHIWDYSKMNFVYTLLSKRKLKWFVDTGRVSGWDDARFPTIRGIRRRGMTIEALRTYVLMQGASQKVLDAEWDKIWAVNKKVIDPVAPRFTALKRQALVRVDVVGAKSGQVLETAVTKPVAKHKKNASVGMKHVTYSNELWIEQDDAGFVVGEVVTLMDWGNVIVQGVERNGDLVERVTVLLDLEGDFKSTEKKLTWLSRIPAPPHSGPLVTVKLLDYDYLITKKKIEEEDDVSEFITPVSEFCVDALGDWNLESVKRGDILQLERKGYYIVDRVEGKEVDLICVPDGKVGTTSSKAAAKAGVKDTTCKAAATTAANDAVMQVKDTKESEKTGKEIEADVINQKEISKMYEVPAIYQHLPLMHPSEYTTMYAVRCIYGDLFADKGQFE